MAVTVSGLYVATWKSILNATALPVDLTGGPWWRPTDIEAWAAQLALRSEQKARRAHPTAVTHRRSKHDHPLRAVT